jgi:hypothetical protein
VPHHPNFIDYRLKLKRFAVESHYVQSFRLTKAVRCIAAEGNKKGSEQSEPFFILILAVTYVPASFPAQYHRPGKA